VFPGVIPLAAFHFRDFDRDESAVTQQLANLPRRVSFQQSLPCAALFVQGGVLKCSHGA
jgi:hypothetical protein